MHAKLQNGCIRSAPKTIVLDGKTINNPLPEELEQLGYKPVLYTDMPEVTEGKHWESEWKEEENAIRQVWTLADAPSLFAKVLIPDENVIPEWEQPESTNPYSKGDKVTHNGKTWISTADGNVWEPGVYGWEEV